MSSPWTRSERAFMTGHWSSRGRGPAGGKKWNDTRGTMKLPSLEGRKLLIVQSLNKDLAPQGKPMVAIDAAGAGIGELVFWCRGKEASFPFKREDTPTDCTIIGRVDSDKHVTSV